jgi:hypothetical protein
MSDVEDDIEALHVSTAEAPAQDDGAGLALQQQVLQPFFPQPSRPEEQHGSDVASDDPMAAGPPTAAQRRSRQPPSAFERMSRNVGDRVKRSRLAFEELVEGASEDIQKVAKHQRVLGDGVARGVQLISIPLQSHAAVAAIVGCEGLPPHVQEAVEGHVEQITRLLSVAGAQQQVGYAPGLLCSK